MSRYSDSKTQLLAFRGRVAAHLVPMLAVSIAIAAGMLAPG